jgi:hypothetical protein
MAGEDIFLFTESSRLIKWFIQYAGAWLVPCLQRRSGLIAPIRTRPDRPGSNLFPPEGRKTNISALY